MSLRKIAVTATMAGALGLTAFGAAGAAQADDDWGPWPNPPGPGVLPPPGHLKDWVGGVPPGHWDDWVPPVLGPAIPFCPDLNPGCINHL